MIITTSSIYQYSKQYINKIIKLKLKFQLLSFQDEASSSSSRHQSAKIVSFKSNQSQALKSPLLLLLLLLSLPMAMKNETELLLLTNGTASTDDESGGKNRRQVQSSPSVLMQGNVGEFTGDRLISSPAMTGGGGRQVDSYFDAHPWFDSDGEDYHSVNGDFGSSRSFSPIDSKPESKIEAEPQPIQPPINHQNEQRRSSTTSRSSSSVKKQLSEFFSESFNRDLEAEIESNQQRTQHDPYYSPSTSTDTSPHEIVSKPVFSDQETATVKKKKSAVKRACIPSLMRSLSCGGGTTKRRSSSTGKRFSHCYGGKN
ncbi:hypothetical protein LINPERPRIM_LOCUS22760 [Linum perenne]